MRTPPRNPSDGRRPVIWLVVWSLLTLLTPPASATPQASPAALRPLRDKWALVVGVGSFQNRSIPGLKYAAKDARDFRDFLVKEANFAPDHVRLLLDDRATQRRVLSELGTKFLARLAKPDDLVVLYFSTHGSPSQADIRGRNFIVAYDSDPDDLFTTGIEMEKIVENIKSRILSDRVLLVLDACHSGSVTPGSKGLTRTGNFDAEAIAQGTGQLVICSSAPEEQSWESKRYNNGIFTRKLLEGLRTSGRKTRLGEAFDYVQKSVTAEAQEDYAHSQTPNLKSKWNGTDLILSSPATAPQDIPFTVKEILEPDSTLAHAAPPSAATIFKPAGAAVGRATPPPAVGSPTSTSKVKSDVERSGAGAAASLENGIRLYRKGDFGSAVAVLTPAVKTTHATSTEAHYYLANALIKVGRTKDALDEYRKCYVLSPKGAMADYCLKSISHYSGGSRSHAAAAAGAANSSAPSFVTPSATPPPRGAGAAAAHVDPQLVARIKAQLPRIPLIDHPRPSVADTVNWSLNELAGYEPEASARVTRAQTQLAEAEDRLKRAESFAHSLLPSARAYGETEVSFNGRSAAARSQHYELTAPYRVAIDAHNKLLSEETSLWDRCRQALQQLRNHY